MQRELPVTKPLLHVMIATIRAKPNYCASPHFFTKPPPPTNGGNTEGLDHRSARRRRIGAYPFKVTPEPDPGICARSLYPIPLFQSVQNRSMLIPTIAVRLKRKFPVMLPSAFTSRRTACRSFTRCSPALDYGEHFSHRTQLCPEPFGGFMLAVVRPDVLVHVAGLVLPAPAGEVVIRREFRPCSPRRSGLLVRPRTSCETPPGPPPECISRLLETGCPARWAARSIRCWAAAGPVCCAESF